MAAGGGSDKYQQALELEAMMVKAFGPDFRDKAIVNALGTFHLASAFEECGLVDPRAPRSSSGAYGLWQMLPYKSEDH